MQPAINRWSLLPSLVLGPPLLRAFAWGFLRAASTCFLPPLLWLAAGRLSFGGTPLGRDEYVCAGTVKEGVGGCMYSVWEGFGVCECEEGPCRMEAIGRGFTFSLSLSERERFRLRRTGGGLEVGGGSKEDAWM